MAHSFVEESFDTGKVIEAEGEKGVSFYLIVDGSVDVRKGEKSIAKFD